MFHIAQPILTLSVSQVEHKGSAARETTKGGGPSASLRPLIFTLPFFRLRQRLLAFQLSDC